MSRRQLFTMQKSVKAGVPGGKPGESLILGHLKTGTFMKRMLTMWVVLLCGTILSGQQHMELLSRVSYQAGVNDVWGYVAPDGTEYALVGLNTGVSIVSLADPTAAEELHFVAGANSTWRDLKTYGDYAYIVNETGQGLMVIDLSAL